MSLRHAFKYKFNDYVKKMRISFPPETDLLKRITEDMLKRDHDIRSVPTVLVAIALEKLPIRGRCNERKICKTIEFAARHICGTPTTDPHGVLQFFSQHAGWNYAEDKDLHKDLNALFKTFSHAHCNLIKHRYEFER